MKRRDGSRWAGLAVMGMIGLLVFSGCAKKKVERVEEGKITLRFTIWGTPEQIKTEKLIIAGFEEKYPDIKIKLEHIPEPYNDKLMTMIVGRTAPDVMMIERGVYPQYAAKGVFLDLEPYIKRDKVDISDIYPLTFYSFRYKGKLYAFPRDISGIVMYYNKTMFEKEGVPFPDENWTWNDFRNACKKLTRDTNGDGIVDQFGSVQPDWFTLIWANGGNILDNPHNPTKCVIDSPEAIAGVQFIVDLYKEKIIAPPRVIREQGSYELFAIGKVGMYFDGRWMAPEFVGIKHFKWDVAPVPKGKVGRVTLHGGTAYGISAYTKYPEEAWKFVEFYCGYEGIKIAVKGGRTTPVYKSLANSPLYLNQRPPENMKAFVETMEINVGKQISYVPENAEIGEIFWRNFDYLVSDLTAGKKVDLKKACEKIKQEVDKLLVKAGYVMNTQTS